MERTTGAARARRRSIASALIACLVPLPWLWFAVERASYAGLGRDQGIFQGTAWAIAHGAALYRDLREINGPLPHEIHWLASLFGGFDPHVLRTFDLTVSGFVFAAFGAALPGALGRAPGRSDALERCAWGAAGSAILLAQYVAFYDFWHLTQRESFFNWFVLGAFACLLHASTRARARGALGLVCLSGVLSALPWFGKPQCALYTGLHLLALGFAPFATVAGLRRRMLAFGCGLALGWATQVAFLALHAGIPEFARGYLLENASYYRYIWPRFLDDIVGLHDHVVFYPIAFVLALLTVSAVVLERVGRQLLGLAAFPLLGIALDIAQGKAFFYHLHPVTAGSAALALALLCAVARAEDARNSGSLWPFALGSALAYFAATALLASPHLAASFAPRDGATRAARGMPEYLRHYDTHSFASVGLVLAAAYLRAHTRPNDRIQLYGQDPYLLALAERQSATPYIYGIDLNPDAVLEGIKAARASDAARARATAINVRNLTDFNARIERANPAAFVFFDHAPFKHPRDAFAEFTKHAPKVAALVRERYQEAPSFGFVRVYLRKDRK